MADEIKKRSNWVGERRANKESYTTDLDRDVRNLFEEKHINLIHLKRYAQAVCVSQG